MKQYKLLYWADQLPVFQNRMFPSSEEARDCVKGDISLVRDLETGLIFNQAFTPELLEYDDRYQNEQALSSAFRQHLNDVMSIVDAQLRGCSLIEVGCGKGTFLELLSDKGYVVTGLDPAYEGDNPKVLKKYFSPQVGINADAIILRHVLEHIRDPYSFLLNIKTSNGGRGKIYIEVPCFDWICDNRSWFDVFYEHVNYFRLADFGRLFGRVYASGRFFGGQYLYIVADLETLRIPVLTADENFEFPSDFLMGFNKKVDSLKRERDIKNAPVVVWGGASKGVIFSLLMQRAGVGVDFVVDINPAKQGMYLPATGIRVSSPEEVIARVPAGSDVIVMNQNYLPEVRNMLGGKFNCMAVEL